MGSNEEAQSSKSDKSSSSPRREQPNNVAVYPDWAAMQAYYGPRVALPPFFNPALGNGHPPPFMWGSPQMMMPPFGAPYAVYAHPGAPYGSQSHGQGVPMVAANVTLAGTSLSMDTPAKSSGNTDQGSVKKVKSFNGLAMSIGNGNTEKVEGKADNKMPKSSESEGSSYGSDRHTEGASGHKKKRSREGSSSSADNEIEETKPNPLHVEHAISASKKVLGFPATTVNRGAGDMVATVLAPPNVVTTMELRCTGVDIKTNLTPVTPNVVAPPEKWIQNDRELKRERRKQSNRESARRSRLRKQAETEELAKRVESLIAENTALRTEINQLVENSGKLKQENSRLMGKLKEIQPDKTIPNKARIKNTSPVSTENLLSRVNNSGNGKSDDACGAIYEKDANSGANRHQLLDASHRVDAVAAR